MAPVARVGLVGLGTIGRVHLRVLQSSPRAEILFTVDPAVTDTGETTVPHYATLPEALRGGRLGAAVEPDLVVVATPTESHLHLAAQALAQSRAVVLVEKPLTHDAGALEQFLEEQAAAASRLRVVNHFGFAPEVEWAVTYARSRGWGPPRHVLSGFNDPYVTKPADRRRSYVSAWVDSGANQLAVLGRFVEDWTIEELTTGESGTRAVGRVEFHGGHAVLLSNWSSGDSSKQTTLRWSGNRELVLDHTSMTGTALEGGRVVEHLGHPGTIDRKTAHYRPMYEALLHDDRHPLLRLAPAVRIARALSTASSPGASPIRWTTHPPAGSS